RGRCVRQQRREAETQSAAGKRQHDCPPVTMDCGDYGTAIAETEVPQSSRERSPGVVEIAVRERTLADKRSAVRRPRPLFGHQPSERVFGPVAIGDVSLLNFQRKKRVHESSSVAAHQRNATAFTGPGQSFEAEDVAEREPEEEEGVGAATRQTDPWRT